MGTRQEELEYGAGLILKYARTAARGSGLEGDVEYAANVCLASPTLLQACRFALKVQLGSPDLSEFGVEDADNGPEVYGKLEAALRAAIRSAEGTTVEA